MLRTLALKSPCSASWISNQQCRAVRQKQPRRQHSPVPLWYICYLVGSSFHLFKAPFGNFPPGLASEKKPYKELRIVLQNTGLRSSEYVSLVLFAFQTAQMKLQMPKKAAGAQIKQRPQETTLKITAYIHNYSPVSFLIPNSSFCLSGIRQAIITALNWFCG